MTAEQLAEWLERHGKSIAEQKAAAMLRKQDAAIKQLRGTLQEIYDNTSGDGDNWCGVLAQSALAATENL